MKYKHKRKQKTMQTWKIFMVFVAFLISISISYSAFSRELNINGNVTGSQAQLSVTYLNVQNSTSYPSTIGYMDTYTNVFALNPTIVSVTMGGNTLTLNTDYTYISGTLTIPNVTGNLVIEGDYAPNMVSVTFDNDGVTNTVSIPAGSTVSRPSPDPTKSGYVFLGWFDANDVEFNFSTPINSSITLYAGYRVQTTAIFKTGKEVNKKMKTLAGSSNPTESTSNTAILYIRKVDTIPTGISTQDVSSTAIPINMWWNSTAKTIYYQSDADVLYANADASFMFNRLTRVREIDLDFRTDNTTTFQQLFYDCQALQTLDVSGFNTENVSNMASVFGNLKALATLDLSNFDTHNVTTMANMFNGSSGITSLDVSNFNTTSLLIMTRMFSSMAGLTELDVSSFDTSGVTTTEKMFDNMIELTTIYVSSTFVIGNRNTNSQKMFNGDVKLVGGSGTAYDASNVGGAYAVIDNPPTNPGYFTDIADKPTT